MSPSGIEPATFRLVAQCLNQLRYNLTHGTSTKPVQTAAMHVRGKRFITFLPARRDIETGKFSKHSSQNKANKNTNVKLIFLYTQFINVPP